MLDPYTCQPKMLLFVCFVKPGRSGDPALLRDYLEWGTAIARDVSRPGADVSSDEPVPVWTWDGLARESPH